MNIMGVISSKIGKICLWQWGANLLFRPRFRVCDSWQGAMSLQYKLTCKFLLFDHFLVPADAIHTFGLRSRFATHSTIITLFADRFAVYFKGIPIFLMIRGERGKLNRFLDFLSFLGFEGWFINKNIWEVKVDVLHNSGQNCRSLPLHPWQWLSIFRR